MSKHKVDTAMKGFRAALEMIEEIYEIDISKMYNETGKKMLPYINKLIKQIK